MHRTLADLKRFPESSPGLPPGPSPRKALGPPAGAPHGLPPDPSPDLAPDLASDLASDLTPELAPGLALDLANLASDPAPNPAAGKVPGSAAGKVPGQGSDPTGEQIPGPPRGPAPGRLPGQASGRALAAGRPPGRDRPARHPWRTGRTWAIPLLAGLLAAAATIGMLATPAGRQIEAEVLDVFFLARGARQAPPDMVIVAIDEPSMQALGLAWPWPRAVHAEFLDRLSAAGARLVVMDVLFAENATPEGDLALERAIADNGRVILASTIDRVEDPAFSRMMFLPPLARLQNAALDTGLGLLTPDPDGAIRRFTPMLGGAPVLAAAAFRQLRPAAPLPLAGGLLDHLGPPRTIRTISYAQVLDQAAPLPASLLQGAVVFVGRSLAAAPELGDQTDAFRTPFSRGDGIPTPGVEIHATMLATMLSGRIGREAPGWATALAALILLPLAALLLAALHAHRSPLAGALACCALSGCVLGASYGLFATLFVWFPAALLSGELFVVEGALLLDGFVTSARERRRIRQAFSRYVSPTVVDMLLNRPQLLEPGGVEADATVLFSDLAGFTSFSERMPPGELMALLSGYFTPMTAIIKEHGGTLDKFIGDAIMAFWGAPLPDRDHAAHACRAALDMARTLESLQRQGRDPGQDNRQDRGVPRLFSRIGIHSGKVVAGNVGSREHMNYTCLGDTVNLASRLESVNKHYATGILLSGETRALLGPEFALRRVDAIRVKGRAEPVEIFELLGTGEPAPEWTSLYEAGLAAYGAREFTKAASLFAQVLEHQPEDGPATILLARSRDLANSPPGPDWDHVHVMESK